MKTLFILTALREELVFLNPFIDTHTDFLHDTDTLRINGEMINTIIHQFIGCFDSREGAMIAAAEWQEINEKPEHGFSITESFEL